ncbi:LytR family transcriptional regulator [Amycolatopsis suaedae]|uniref:LytR family transcriptional regulator n=2 Tax=Amycolatopsis suaedae TaxID=2510978 RepID=A0A4Q7JEE8_9PSEU|nr:LytR family transcriptional regulator [Amycolatopsis suaedae]
MDTYGGISVSDVVAKHTGAHPRPQVDEPPTRQVPPARQPRRQAAGPPPESPRRPAAVNPPPAPRTSKPPARRAAPNPAQPPKPPQPRRATPPPAAAKPKPQQPSGPQPKPPPVDPPTRLRQHVGSIDAADQPPARPPRRQPPPPRRPVEGRTTVTPPVAAPGGPQRPPQRRPARPQRSAEDRLTMTDQMEPVDDATRVRRKIDNTLARFSAAHDELEREEERKRQRRERLTAGPVKLIEQTRTRLQRVVTSPSEEPEPEEPAKPELTRLQEKKQRHQDRTARIARITAAALACLVFLATGGLWGTKTWFNSKFNEIAALDENSADIKNAAGQNGDENFLIAGSDTRAGAEAEEGVGTAEAVGGARSDSLMIAHVPADRKRAVVVGFPRDLEVTRPECQRWDSKTGQYTGETVPAKPRAKLNEAFAIGGPACTTKLVQQLTGMKINHFVGIDFHGFKGMIDVVGGVPIHVDKPIIDEELGTVIPTAGDIVVSGDQALNYVRVRKVKGDPTSDYGRIKRQQQVIGALLKKTMSREVLLDTGKLSGLVTAFAGATFGDNIGVDQLLTLAQSMQGLDPNKVKFLTIPTVGESNSRGNEEMLEKPAKALFEALIENVPLPDEKAPAPPPTPNAQAQPGK